MSSEAVMLTLFTFDGARATVTNPDADKPPLEGQLWTEVARDSMPTHHHMVVHKGTMLRRFYSDEVDTIEVNGGKVHINLSMQAEVHPHEQK